MGEEEALIRAGRFSPSMPLRLGRLTSGTGASIYLPAGLSGQPWQLLVDNGPVRICAVR